MKILFTRWVSLDIHVGLVTFNNHNNITFFNLITHCLQPLNNLPWRHLILLNVSSNEGRLEKKSEGLSSLTFWHGARQSRHSDRMHSIFFRHCEAFIIQNNKQFRAGLKKCGHKLTTMLLVYLLSGPGEGDMMILITGRHSSWHLVIREGPE